MKCGAIRSIIGGKIPFDPNIFIQDFFKGGRALIEVKNLVKRYGDHTAVNRLNFTVEEGQIYGFLGPNGAGKSTTMNIITGYLAATEGEVTINGHNILEEPEEAKKCIGYLPEIPPLYMDMTVLEYLKFAAELKKIPKEKREKHIKEIMSLVKITDMKNRLIKNLSKGYRQRVGLAQAILGYPPIIILDEPTVGLDPKQIIEIRDLIKSLGKKHTVILSSHILSEVSAVCDYVMIIANGRLVASDTPDNLSKLTLGSNTVEASIKGTRNTVVKILNQIEEIQNIKYKDSELPGCVDVTITTAKDKDIREELFYKMAGARCPILHINSSTMSLEDIFLQLTENPGKAEKAKTETPQAISAEESEAAQAGESEKVSGEDENVPEEAAEDEMSPEKGMEKVSGSGKSNEEGEQ